MSISLNYAAWSFKSKLARMVAVAAIAWLALSPGGACRAEEKSDPGDKVGKMPHRSSTSPGGGSAWSARPWR
jgi:hypothetical protein